MVSKKVLTRDDAASLFLKSVKQQAEYEASLPEGPFSDSPDGKYWERKYKKFLPLVTAKDYEGIAKEEAGDSYTKWHCSICNKFCDRVVEYEGEGEDDEEFQCRMCEGCLASGVLLLSGER